MQYLLTPYSEKIEPYAWWNNAFNEEQLNWLQNRAKQAEQVAQIGSGGVGQVNKNIRRSELSWLSNTPETEWVFLTLAHVVSDLNSKYFRFNLTGLGESIQLTNYSDTEKGMYGWHVDFGSSGPSRKLSLVLQLSDPVDYEGGVLELKPHGDNIIKVSKQRGLIVVFPSWTLHQVTPVTQGSRQSLVSWITGPSFK
jgi:PKHD-type hydroxylase